jgi:hypothetical protein
MSNIQSASEVYETRRHVLCTDRFEELSSLISNFDTTYFSAPSLLLKPRAATVNSNQHLVND